MVAGGDETTLVGEHDCLGAVSEPEFGQDAGDVALDRGGPDVERVGDLGVAGSCAELGEDLTFAVGERVEPSAGGGVGGERLGEASDETPGDGGVEQRASAGDGAHSGGEFFWWDVLEHEATGAGLEGPVHVLVGVEGGQDDDLEGPVGLFEDGCGGCKAVHFRHADVHQHDVGSVLADGVDGLEAVARFGDDIDVGLVLEDHRKAATHEGLVVDDGDADGHVLSISKGMWALTRKRSGGSGSAVKVPPSSAARSRMPAMPYPDAGSPAAAPWRPERAMVLTMSMTSPTSSTPTVRWTEGFGPACLMTLVRDSCTMR